MIIAKGANKQEIKKKAIELRQAMHVFSSGPVILAKEFHAKTIAQVPVIEEQELESMSRFNDLKELIRERARKSQ